MAMEASAIEGDTSPGNAGGILGDEQLSAQRVLNILDRMDPKVIFMLYQKLAIDTRDKLEQSGLLPEVSPPETKGRHQSEHYQNHQQTSQRHEHAPLKSIVTKLI